jgi:amino acid permease
VTIIVFIILGIVVNAGGNTSHEYIGGKNWRIGDAPFVGGFGGFARVFVTASFACEYQTLYADVMFGLTLRSSRRWN